MASPDSRVLVDGRRADGVTVVAFTGRELLNDEEIDWLGEWLRGLADNPADRRLVLNFRAVALMATDMIGELLGLLKKRRAVEGRLALCEFNPDLRGALEALRLHQVFDLYDSEQEAVRSLTR
jgi:anti-anti-sigma factor